MKDFKNVFTYFPPVRPRGVHPREDDLRAPPRGPRRHRLERGHLARPQDRIRVRNHQVPEEEPKLVR